MIFHKHQQHLDLKREPSAAVLRSSLLAMLTLSSAIHLARHSHQMHTARRLKLSEV